MNEKVNIEKEFRCKICDKTYSSASSLCNHNKKFHNKLNNTPIIHDNTLDNTQIIHCKKYKCHTCKKTFNNFQNRWKHEKICKQKADEPTTKQELEELKKTINELKIELEKTKKHDEPNVNKQLINIIVDKDKTIEELKNKIIDEPEIIIVPKKIQSTITINDVEIISRMEDNYINATQLCQAGGKLFADWYRLNTTKQLINEAVSDMGIPISQLVDIKKGNTNEYNQGTWLHPDLAIQLAQWISSKFALQVSKWIRNLFTDGNVSIEIKLLEEKNKELQLKDQKIKLLENTYLKRHKRTNYPEKFVVYLLTTKEHKNKRIYIVGKAKNLKKRLSGYNKTCDHEVIYYKSCGNEENMNTVEHMVLTKLNQYREKANRDRFVLPIEKEIDFFTNIIDKSVEFLQNNNEIVV